MARTSIINLPDGRKLAFDEHGPEDGIPLFYFHGAPSARIEVELFGLPAVANELGIRLISPDRPGLGLSDFQEGRKLADWPLDLQELAVQLEIDQFFVLGYSGGGPYALACARYIPERLLGVTTVSGTGPFTTPGLADQINTDSLRFMRLSVEKPLVAGFVTSLMAFTARQMPERMVARASSALSGPDKRTMSKPEFGAAFARLVAEAARKGSRGPRVDTALMVTSWGFDPAHITIPVKLWHGEEDRNSPIAMARYLSGKLPSNDLIVVPDEGHLSLILTHAREILSGSVAHKPVVDS